MSYEPTRSGKAGHNVGMPLEVAAQEMTVEINLSAVQSYFANRNVTKVGHLKDKWLAGWMLRCVSCCFLEGDTSIRPLAAAARQPIPSELTKEWRMPQDVVVGCFGVWVKPHCINEAAQLLRGSGLRVGSNVSLMAPGDATPPMRERLSQIEAATKQGADNVEVDASTELCNAAIWHELYEEVRAMKEAADGAKLVVRLPIVALGSLTNIHRCSLVCMLAGADCIAIESVEAGYGEFVAGGCNSAEFEVGMAVLRAIQAYAELSGIAVAFKAPRLTTADGVVSWLALVRDVLGELWTRPGLFLYNGAVLENVITHIRADTMTSMA